MRSSPKFSPITWVNWLEKGGKKNVGDKSWKFFKEGYIHDIYIGNESHIQNLRSYFTVVQGLTDLLGRTRNHIICSQDFALVKLKVVDIVTMFLA